MARKTTLAALCILLAALFAATGMPKAQNFNAFRGAVDEYKLLPHDMLGAAAAGIIATEIALVFLLLMPKTRRLALGLAAALLFLFAGTMGLTLAFDPGAAFDCGCRLPGLWSEKIGWNHVAFNLALSAYAWLGAALYRPAGLSHFKNWLFGYVLFACFVLSSTATAKMLFKEQSSLAQRMVGKTAPAFTVYDLQGRKHVVNYSGNRDTYLMIMRPGCPLCEEVLPQWEQLYAREKKSADFFCISFTTASNTTQDYVRQRNLQLPVFMIASMEQKEFADQFELRHPPDLFLIKPGGIIAFRQSGVPEK